MTEQYDLIANGTGTGASGAAAVGRKAGWKVAVVDNLPFGGTCALRGHLPNEVQVGEAQALDHPPRVRGKGIGGEEPSIVWNELIEFERTFTEPVLAMRGADYAKDGIDAYHGRARFRGPRSIEVGGEVLEGRFILIATGAVTMRLGIPGEEHLLTSTGFLELDRLPRKIVDDVCLPVRGLGHRFDVVTKTLSFGPSACCA